MQRRSLFYGTSLLLARKPTLTSKESMSTNEAYPEFKLQPPVGSYHYKKQEEAERAAEEKQGDTEKKKGGKWELDDKQKFWFLTRFSTLFVIWGTIYLIEQAKAAKRASLNQDKALRLTDGTSTEATT